MHCAVNAHSVGFKNYEAMLCRGICLVAAYPEVHISHINAFSGQNVEFLNVKCGSA